jgi:hypothetical protein
LISEKTSLINQRIRTTIILSMMMVFAAGKSFSQDTIMRELEQSRWEKLVSNSLLSLYFRISVIGSSNFFDLRIIRNDEETFSIGMGQQFVLYLKNSDSVAVSSPTNIYSCRGCGAVTLAVGGTHSGIEVSYLISKEDLQKMENSHVKKVSLYTTKEKIETNITEKEYSKILNAIIATQDL